MVLVQRVQQSIYKPDQDILRWVCRVMNLAFRGFGDLYRRWGLLKEGALFRVHQTFNSYGRSLRVKTTRGQGKPAIIIPEIDYNVRWSDVANKIIRSLGKPVKPDLQKFITPGK